MHEQGRTKSVGEREGTGVLTPPLARAEGPHRHVRQTDRHLDTLDRVLLKQRGGKGAAATHHTVA